MSSNTIFNSLVRHAKHVQNVLYIKANITYRKFRRRRIELKRLQIQRVIYVDEDLSK